MVLIEVRNSEGIVGRCDAKCYLAEHENCECVCGGKNHGAGLQQAMDNTREQAEQWIEEYAKRQSLESYQAEINGWVYQMNLFELEA